MTSEKTKTSNLKKDSAPLNLEVVRCSLGTVVRSATRAYNSYTSYTSSSELGAQYVQPHQKPKRPHLQEKDMPVAFCRTCHVVVQKLKLQQWKWSFGCSDWLHSEKNAIHRVRVGPPEQQDLAKKVQNQKAICFT